MSFHCMKPTVKVYYSSAHHLMVPLLRLLCIGGWREFCTSVLSFAMARSVKDSSSCIQYVLYIILTGYEDMH